MVTVRSSVNACVASGDASTIADSSVLVRSSRASAAFRAAISDCDASSAVRRLVVARQPSASAKATRAVNDAIVTPVAVPMNRTCAGPTRTASATPTLATTTAAIDASAQLRRVERALDEGDADQRRDDRDRHAVRQHGARDQRLDVDGHRGRRTGTTVARWPRPAASRSRSAARRPRGSGRDGSPGSAPGSTTAPMSATTGAPTSVTRSHTARAAAARSRTGRCDDMARRRGTISILRGAATTTGQPRPAITTDAR